MEQTTPSNTRSARTSATTRSCGRWTRSGSASCGSRWASACVLVLVLLFSAWQHFELIRHGYRLEQMQRERAAEADVNRHLRLEIETLRAAQRIEKLATEQLGHDRARPRRRVVLERVIAAAAAGGIGGRGPLTRTAGTRRGRSTPSRLARSRFDAATPSLAVVFLCWTVGDRRPARCSCRSSATTTSGPRRAPTACASFRRRPSAATSTIATADCWPIASTPTPSTRCRARSRPGDGRDADLRRLDRLRSQ